MAEVAGTMRLDRFLWFARLTRTRSAAQAVAERGLLRIDGRRVDRAHCPVRVGSVLAFPHNGEVRVLRIEALPARRGPAPEAQALYTRLDAGRPSGAGAVPQSPLTPPDPGNSRGATATEPFPQ